LFGKKGANDIYSPPMSSISFHEEVQVETLEANNAHKFKMLLCLYENEYLMCKAKNSSNDKWQIKHPCFMITPKVMKMLSFKHHFS
jgi:hypothetical protein